MATKTKLLKFYKKITNLKDLRDAIKFLKKAIKSGELYLQKSESNNLKYLGKSKLRRGVLSHLIGTTSGHDNFYRLSIDLEKYSKGEKSVSVELISPKGETIETLKNRFVTPKSGIRAIVNHFHKKKWD